MLTINHICTLSSMLDKMNISIDLIKTLFEQGKNFPALPSNASNFQKEQRKEQLEKRKEEIGIQIFFELAKKLHLVKEEIIELIVLEKGVTKKEAEKVDAISFIKEFLKDKGTMGFLESSVMSK